MPEAASEPRSTEPRYLRLARELVGEIERGRYPIGALIPTEFELCERFGASRFTIREAVKRLVDLGLVSRQAGIGTRVLARHPTGAYRQTMTGIADLQHYTHDTELQITDVGLVRLPADIAAGIGEGDAAGWLRLSGLRRLADEASAPICVTEIYIHPDFRAVRGLGGRAVEPVFTRLEEQFGVTIAEVRQEIRAGILSGEIAARLDAVEGAPALLVTRTYLDAGGRILEVALSTHPAERFAYGQTFRRAPAARAATPLRVVSA